MSAYKRKSDYISDHSSYQDQTRNQPDHRHKKPRPENGNGDINNRKSHPSSNGGPSQDKSRTPPALPPISRQYMRQVFTHPSIASDPNSNYERLEFLGDAQIEHIASIVIFERYTAATPGKMSTIREKLVNNERLAEYSRLYGFDQRLKLSPGMYQPKDATKIHGDVFEAYVAAVIFSDVDREYGFEAAVRWLTELWEPLFKQFGLKLMGPKDVQSKEILARSLLIKGAKLSYKDNGTPIHNKDGTHTYYMGAYYTGFGHVEVLLGSGEGDTKNSAGQAAAKEAMSSDLVAEIMAKRAAFLLDKEKQEIKQENAEEVEKERRKEERRKKEQEEKSGKPPGLTQFEDILKR